MATISNIGDAAREGDTVSAAWINAVNSQTAAFQRIISELRGQIESTNSLVTPFALGIASNTSISYGGGVVMLGDRTTAAISSGTIDLTVDGRYFVYVDGTGQVAAELVLPLVGYEIGVAVVEGGRVASVQNHPPARIRSLREDYLTLEEIRPLVWHRVSSARLTTPQPFRTLGNPPYTDRYLVVGFNSVEYSQTTESGFTGFNDAGEFTTSEVGKTYAIHAQIRLTGQPNQNLSGKISAFVTGQGELEIALAQAESANGDLVLNGQNALPVGINPGDIATVQAYLTEGDGDVIINRGSAVTIWEVPDNSSLIPIQ